MSNGKGKRALDDLNAQVASSREALLGTLEELTYELQPKVQAQHFVEDAKYRATQAAYDVADTAQKAKEGNPEARKKILKAAGAVAGALLVLRLRSKMKKRRRVRREEKQLQLQLDELQQGEKRVAEAQRRLDKAKRAAK